MKIMRKWGAIGILMVALAMMGASVRVYGSSEAAPAAAGEAAKPAVVSPTFFQVIMHSGPAGTLLWILLIGCSVTMCALTIDSFITISKKKVVNPQLVELVNQAMAVGDLLKAKKHCQEHPGALSTILQAGYAQIEEGWEVINDAVAVAAEMESEKLLQRVSYLNVIANVAPMLGLVGTVQGMINAFINMGTTEAGAAQQAMLALNIGEGLWATAVGLGQTVPALIFYQFFKNRVNTISLYMEQITMDSIKVLRNVEVVEEK